MSKSNLQSRGFILEVYWSCVIWVINEFLERAKAVNLYVTNPETQTKKIYDSVRENLVLWWEKHICTIVALFLFTGEPDQKKTVSAINDRMFWLVCTKHIILLYLTPLSSTSRLQMLASQTTSINIGFCFLFITLCIGHQTFHCFCIIK